MQDLNDLMYFAEVVDRGGFAAAGRSLGLPKSRISRRVAELEARLGVRLLHRTTRKLSLTAVGEQFHRHCVAMREDALAAEDAVAQARNAPRGTIRVACAVTLAQTTLGPILPRFLERYPLVNVDMRVSNRAVDLVEEGLDVALRVRPTLDDSGSLASRTQSQAASLEQATANVREVSETVARNADSAFQVSAMTRNLNLEAEEAVDLAHPLGVALGEIVVHGDDMHALAGQRVQIGRQRGDQRLAFAGLHFGDAALVEDHAADELHVEVAHAERPHARLADEGEGLRHEVVELPPVLDLLLPLRDELRELLVPERLHPRLELPDAGNERAELLHLALVLRADDVLQEVVHHGRVVSLSEAPARVPGPRELPVPSGKPGSLRMLPALAGAPSYPVR